MPQHANSAVRRLEEQLEGAERTLSGMQPLQLDDAQRVADRMDRLASQLLAVTQPPPMASVHERLGTTPVGDDEFARAAEQMDPPDGEG